MPWFQLDVVNVNWLSEMSDSLYNYAQSLKVAIVCEADGPDGDPQKIEGKDNIEEYFDPNGQDLIEFTVTEHHAWNHKYIRDLNLPDNKLIISINRNDEIIPATGNTLIQTEDRVLLFKGKNTK